MSTLLERVRTRRRAAASMPSVREVCLLGTSRATSAAAGERLILAGRVYRVESTRPRSGLNGDDAAARYVHLAPCASGETD